MGESFINLSRIAWLVGIAVLVMIANVLVGVLYMVVYSYLIDPGHENEYYDAHIQIAAPIAVLSQAFRSCFLRVGGSAAGGRSIFRSSRRWLSGLPTPSSTSL